MIMQRIRKGRRYLSRDGLGPYLVRALAGSAAVRIGAAVASFAVGVQLARMLGVEGYGYYGLALAIITIAGIPGELGVSRVVMREAAIATASDDRPRLFGVLRWGQRMVLGLSAIAALLAVAAAFVVEGSRFSVLAVAILCGAPAIPFLAMTRVRTGALQGMQYVVRGLVPSEVLRPVLISVALLAVYAAGTAITVAGVMALYSLTAAAVFVVAYAWLRRRLPDRTGVQPAQHSRRWLASSIPMALTDGMRILQSELAILAIGIIAAPASAGLFRIAASTASIAVVGMLVAGQVAFPVLAKLHADNDRARLQKAVTGFACVQLAAVTILAMPLIIAPELLIRLVFGDSFVPAATALRILAAGHIVNAAFGPNAILLNMTHHERRATRAMAIALVLNLILVPLFVILWGIIGAACALLVCLSSWNVILWLDAKRLLSIETSAIGAGVNLRARRANAP